MSRAQDIRLQLKFIRPVLDYISDADDARRLPLSTPGKWRTRWRVMRTIMAVIRFRAAGECLGAHHLGYGKSLQLRAMFAEPTHEIALRDYPEDGGPVSAHDDQGPNVLDLQFPGSCP